MEISSCFATSLATPEHIVLAEKLGYRRAWCYDSPALYPDVWMTLARTADRTERIGLGPGVLVPSLRHVLTNAAAIATLEALAPGRISVAVGSGFTGRVALGQRPMSWKAVQEYIVALRALLRGEEVEWEGAAVRLLHLDGFAPPRPIATPILVAINGPRGLAVAQAVGDGVLTTGPGPEDASAFAWRVRMGSGTVLAEGESAESPRAVEAVGHRVALLYHRAYESRTLDRLPHGEEFARRVEALPARSRHLSLHEGHLVRMNALDRAFLAPDLVARFGGAGTAAEWRDRLAALAAEGITEYVYQPGGPDIPRELTAFAAAAGLG